MEKIDIFFHSLSFLTLKYDSFSGTSGWPVLSRPGPWHSSTLNLRPTKEISSIQRDLFPPISAQNRMPLKKLVTSKFKVLENLKICAFDYFNCDVIFHVIRILNCYVCQRTMPDIFEKSVCRYHFYVAQNSAGKSKMHAAASTWCPRCCEKFASQVCCKS